MSSRQYATLMRNVHNLKKKIEKIEISFGEQEHALITFDDGSTTEITEYDAFEYALNLKRGIDNDGDFVFVPVLDLNRYFEHEQTLLTRRDEKIATTSEEYASGKFTFDYDIDELQKSFLLSRQRNNKQFEPLRRDYYYIVAYRMHEAAMLLKLHDKFKSDSPDYEQYYLAASKILAAAFGGNENFIKNFASRNNSTQLDLLASMNKYLSTLEHSKSMNSIIRGAGIEATAGMKVVLDSYRRSAEVCIDLMNFLRIAHELNQGIDKPENEKGAEENKRILSAVFGDKLNCYDPHIRNSESHLWTRYDQKNHKVLIEDRNNYSAEYNYKNILDMTNDLIHNLLPALVTACLMETQAVLLVLSYMSKEYITALLFIDNS